MGADDVLKGSADLLAVPGEQAGLAVEGLEAHLPVGEVGPPGGDP